MKQLNSLLFASLICSILLLLASCSPEDETPAPGVPQVTIVGDGIDNNTFVGSPGETINATVNVQAPSGFNTLIIRKYVDGTEEGSFTERVTRGAGTTAPQTFSHNFEYTLMSDEVGTDLSFTFEAVDENNRSGIATLNVETEAQPAARYTSVLLFAPLETGESETFFSTNTGETYSLNEVLNSSDPLSADIDFGYFYGEQFQASLAAPAAYPIDYGQGAWVVRNNTRIGKTNITPGQYVEITDNNVQAINDAYNAAEFGANPNLVTNLLVGQILAFETDNTKTGGSKRGLIQVQSIEAGTGSTGKIQIEVLVLQ